MEWSKANPDKVRLNLRNYRHRKRSQVVVDERFTLEQWTQIKFYANYRCLACGTTEEALVLYGQKLTMDHVVPLSIGGLHHHSNIQPLCASCNSSKSDKTIDYRTLRLSNGDD